MKRFISSGCLMIFFLLLTPLPARAEITVTIINGSPLEINYLYLESGEGGMGSSMNLVPGNRINMNDGNASVLRKLTVFAGTGSYVFEAMNLPGPNQVLRFVLRDGGIRHLSQREKPSRPHGERALMLKPDPSGTTIMLRGAAPKYWRPGWKPIPGKRPNGQATGQRLLKGR